jgi:hypothetical protein
MKWMRWAAAVGFGVGVGLVFQPMSWAQIEVEPLNMDHQAMEHQGVKVSELELGQEVEEMEAFGEAARAQTAKVETAEMKAEARRLEKEIAQMQRQNDRAKSRVKDLNLSYAQKERLARDAFRKHTKVARVHRNLKAKVERLQSRVEEKELRAIEFTKKRKAADLEVARLSRLERQLNRREAEATRTIERERRRLQKSSGKVRSLAARVKRQESRVLSLDQKAAFP